jgi:aminoglycoside 3-N-acetyltransferase
MSTPPPPNVKPTADLCGKFASNAQRKAEEFVSRTFSALGIAADRPLVVHCSFGGLARTGLHANAVADAMVDFLSPTTLLMPTMSWHSVNPKNPIFDELATPGITGVLSEVFRQCHATRRSLHPTHSVAAKGNMADALLATHHLEDTPCHARSPWGLLDDVSANVLLVGIGMERCTLIHHVEELVAPELYLQPPQRRERYLCRDRFGNEIVMHTRRHLKQRRNFHIFEDELARRGGVHYAKEGEVRLRAFRADAMVAVALEMLRREPDLILTQPTDLSA